MAKKILVSGLKNNIPVANSGLKLSKNILIEKIEPHPKFQELFNIEESLRNRISNDMDSNGYDASQPIHIWVVTDDDGITHNYLIDGYTRVAAAKQSKLEQIPYYEHKFSSFEEAHRYVLHLQIDRRNLDGNTLLNNLRELMGSEYVMNYEGKKSKLLAEQLGVGERTVQKAMSVEKSATSEQKQRIENGEASINQIYEENRTPSKNHVSEKTSNIEVEEIKSEEPKAEIKKINDKSSKRTEVESLSDNSGIPSGLNFSHTDGIERPNYAPTAETAIDSWSIEKNKQVERARIEGFAKGFETALIFTLAEIKKGRTPEEVYKDDRISDLSPTVLSNFNLPKDDEDIVGEF